MEREHSEACICDKCGIEFESQGKLRMHTWTKHPKKQDKNNPTKTFLTLQVKGQLIQESKSPGMTNQKLSEKYGIHKSSVSKLLKNQSRILTKLAKPSHHPHPPSLPSGNHLMRSHLNFYKEPLSRDQIS